MLLQAIDLYYGYEKGLLFSDVNFKVKPGEVLQVSGKNGRGKTTLLKILAGLLVPEKGEVLWNDASIFKKPEDYRFSFIYISHSLGLKSALTAFENLYLFAQLSGEKVREVEIFSALKKMDLFYQKDQLAHSLSAGQKQRLALAKLFLISAKLWILDEPFSGLSQEGQSLMVDEIQEHINSGGQVVFTAHHWVDLQVSAKVLSL